MPKLTELSETNRQVQMLTVLRLIREIKNKETKETYTIEEACAEVGLTRGQYYHWLTRSDEAIEAFREVLADYGRVELASAMIAHQDITDQLINDALAQGTEPMVRLAILNYLNGRIELMADRHKARGGDAAREFLNGPQLESVESRFSPGSTVNIKPMEDGSVDVTIKKHGELIDVTVIEEMPGSDPTAIPKDRTPARLLERGAQQSTDQVQSLLESMQGETRSEEMVPWR